MRTQVIYGLIYLFYEPNPDDPLNHEAADLYRNNIARFQQVTRILRVFPPCYSLKCVL